MRRASACNPVASLYAPTPAAARPNTTGLVMGYASLDEQAIKRGVWMLGEILETFAAEEGAAAASG
jgi:GntR family transcriptional regulator / MocR family aminotransferase